MITLTPGITIADSELEFSFVRSSGPGGQNVNKVNSKAILRWSAGTSAALAPAVRARFLARYGGLLTAEGEIVLASDRFRDQPRNREDCLQKLRAMVLQVAHAPKARRKTRPTRASQKRRHESKQRRSQTKRQRARVSSHE